MGIFIGIDPGTKTGVAVWNTKAKCFELITTTTIDKAFQIVFNFQNKGQVFVRFEDPRHIGGRRERAQGAGSVKRDAAIWETFLKNNQIKYEAVRAGNSITKMNANYFKQLTGYQDRTSEHGRDAAMLVYTWTENMIKKWKQHYTGN